MQWQERIAPAVEDKTPVAPSEEDAFRERMAQEIAILEVGERAEHSPEAQELFAHLFGADDALDALIAGAAQQFEQALDKKNDE